MAMENKENYPSPSILEDTLVAIWLITEQHENSVMNATLNAGMSDDDKRGNRRAVAFYDNFQSRTAGRSRP